MPDRRARLRHHVRDPGGGWLAVCLACTAGRDGVWLLRVGGAAEGAVVLDGSRASPDGAQLRRLILSDVARAAGRRAPGGHRSAAR